MSSAVPVCSSKRREEAGVVVQGEDGSAYRDEAIDSLAVFQLLLF